MEGDGRRIVYPPIHEAVDQWGDTVYRVQMSDRMITFYLGDVPSREEAFQTVREQLLDGLRDGRFPAFEFYPDDRARSQVYYDVASHVAVNSHEHHCFGGTPASGKAIVDLPKPSVKEGECCVCLENFETGNKLRMMPCSHSFHEDCIFNWLRLSHVCPLCRFPLPTQQQ